MTRKRWTTGFVAPHELRDRIDKYRKRVWSDDNIEVSRAEFLRQAADEKLKREGV